MPQYAQTGPCRSSSHRRVSAYAARPVGTEVCRGSSERGPRPPPVPRRDRRLAVFAGALAFVGAAVRPGFFLIPWEDNVVLFDSEIRIVLTAMSDIAPRVRVRVLRVSVRHLADNGFHCEHCSLY